MSVTEQHMNARLEAAEARTETRFTQLMGEIKLLSANMGHLNEKMEKVETRLDGVESTLSNMKWHMVYIGIAVVTAVVAVMAYGLQMFDFALGAVGHMLGGR